MTGRRRSAGGVGGAGGVDEEPGPCGVSHMQPTFDAYGVRVRDGSVLVQPGQDRQHAAVVLGLGGRSSLVMMLPMWLSTVLGVSTSSRAIAALERPWAIRARTPRSRSLSVARLVAPRAAAEQEADHVGIEDRLPRRDPVHRVDQHGDVEHTVLEQVAEALRVRAGEVRGVAALQRLRQQEQPDVGSDSRDGDRRRARPRGCRSAASGCRRGRRRVGVPRPHVRAPGASPTIVDDLDAGLREQAGEALAQEHRVVGDHDPHGSSPRNVVPAGLDEQRRRAAQRPRRGPRARAGPRPPGSAPPRPSSLDLHRERCSSSP